MTATPSGKTSPIWLGDPTDGKLITPEPSGSGNKEETGRSASEKIPGKVESPIVLPDPMDGKMLEQQGVAPPSGMTAETRRLDNGNTLTTFHDDQGRKTREIETDANGKKVREKEYNPETGKLKRDTRYNSDEKPTLDEQFDNEGRLREKNEFEYDSEGKQTKLTRTEFDENKVPIRKEVRDPANGNKIETFNPKNGRKVKEDYHPNGRIKHREVTQPDPDNFMDITIEDNVWDADGNLIHTTV